MVAIINKNVVIVEKNLSNSSDDDVYGSISVNTCTIAMANTLITVLILMQNVCEGLTWYTCHT